MSLFKKWFHIFSFFLVVFSVLLVISQVYLQEIFVLEIKLGIDSSEVFVSSVFVLDNVSSVFVLMVGSVSFIVMKYAYWYMPQDKKVNAFFVTFFVFVFFMFLLAISSSLFWVIFSWDGLGVTSFCLVMFFSNWKSFNSAMITFLINRFGDFFFILGIWALTCFFSDNSVNYWIVGVFVALTGMTKSAQVPFSAWLPAAMAAPTPVSSLVHSSTLVTAGIYLFSRFHFLLGNGGSKLIYCSSILTLILSTLSAMGENDLKKIIALSTLSHLGFMMFFLSKAMVQSTLIHLLIHAFFKSLLFMVAGVIIHYGFNSQDIRKLSSLNLPLSLVLIISMVANMGLPFFSGFYSKEILIFSLFGSEGLVVKVLDMAIMILSISLTCSYSLRIIFLLMSKENNTLLLESSPFSYHSMSKWMLFSSLFSCLLGGVSIWVVVDPAQMVESSFFLKLIKMLVPSIILISFLFMKLKWWDFFNYQNSNFWFIYEFSKNFSKNYFKMSHQFLWQVDSKGLTPKTSWLPSLLLKEELFLKKPKKVFLGSITLFIIFLIQIVLLVN